MRCGFVFNMYSMIAINLMYSDLPNNSFRSLREMAVESVPATSLQRGGRGWTIPGTKRSTSYISFGHLIGSYCLID